MNRCFPLLVIALTGCVGQLGDGALDAEATEEREVDREAWADAPAGCEDAPPGSEVVRAEGEPWLGGLVDGDGNVICVDDLALLRVEQKALHHEAGPSGADPSPQPSRDTLERGNGFAPVTPAPTPTPGSMPSMDD